MLEHTLKLLEFEHIRQAVCELASNAYTKEMLKNASFFYNPDELGNELNQVAFLHQILAEGNQIPSLPSSDLNSIFKILAKEGSVLEIEELIQIALHIQAAAKLRSFLLKLKLPPQLKNLFEKIEPPLNLANKVFAFFEPEASIKIKEIPQLAKIEQSIKRIKKEIEEHANQLLNNPNFNGFFQTNLATIKDGRLVLPVKANYKGRIKGIVHDVSSSGATVFIEPASIVELNNEIIFLENNFKAEVHKILADLTKQIRQKFLELKIIFEAICRFDFLLAKARYGLSLNANPCNFSNTNEIILLEARHPLLGSKAVPISLSLTKDEHILIITGPNTGGKTVTLKTVGLLACMNQFGLEIPASVDSSLPIFDSIWVDIGDEQSIQQSFSTFQAHLKNLTSIVKLATPQSLILLDEICAGTDPQEGIALAMSLLDYFCEKKIKTLVTTHHGILKNYAFSHPGVLNASVEFDHQKLSPTYRLIMGLPGESHALVIAKRCGLPQTFLQKASLYLEEGQTDYNRLIQELIRQKENLLKLEDELKVKNDQLKETLRRLELKELTLKQKECQLRQQGLAELNSYLSQTRASLEKLIREIKEGHSQEAIAESRQLIQNLGQKLEEEKIKFEALEKELNPPKPLELKPGCLVKLKSNSEKGRLIRLEKDGKAVVQTETLRLKIKVQELEVLNDAAETDFKKSGQQVISPDLKFKPELELNVRGLRLPEALRRLEKYLDEVIVAGLKECSILHGKGTGALQTAINEYLANSPYVESFGFALPEQGGSGRTLVKIKSFAKP